MGEQGSEKIQLTFQKDLYSYHVENKFWVKQEGKQGTNWEAITETMQRDHDNRLGQVVSLKVLRIPKILSIFWRERQQVFKILDRV